MKRSNLMVVAVAGAILASGVATAAPIYMKYEGIPGDANAAGHEKWIEVQSVQWSVQPPAAPAAPAPAGVAAGGPGRIVLSRKVDKASPLLSRAATSGKVVPTAQLDMPKTTVGGSSPYMRYELKNVMVTSYSASGPAAGGSVPMESLSLNYAKIEYRYDDKKPAVAAPNRRAPK